MSARDENTEHADATTIRDGLITADQITDAPIGPDVLVDLLDRLDDDTQAATIARTRMGRERRILGRGEYQRLQAFAVLVSDLDRSPVGRHEGDVESQDPTGTSQGNPILPTGTQIGWGMDGHPIVMPPRKQRHDPAAWRSVLDQEDG